MEGKYFELPPSTFELTRITDVKPGDYVLSLNEETQAIEPRRIKGLLDMGVKPVFKLTTASGRSIKTTANHPYLVNLRQTQEDTAGTGPGGLGWDGARGTQLGQSQEDITGKRRTAPANRLSRTRPSRLAIQQPFQPSSNELSGDYTRWTKVSELKEGMEIAAAGEKMLAAICPVANSDTFNKDSVTLQIKGDAVFSDTETMSARRQINQRISADKRIFQCGSLSQFFVNAFLDFSGEAFKVAFAARRKLNGIHYASPNSRLTFSNGINPFFFASAIDFFKERTNLGFKGSFDSISSISQPAGFTDLSWYSSADNLSTNSSSILESTSNRAKESKIKSWGAPFLSTITAALESLPSLNTELGATLLKGINFADLNFAGESFITNINITRRLDMSRLFLSDAEAAQPALSGVEGPAAESPVLWDKIVSIEPLPAERVYDIEVEGTHNFIGNGIFAHNTYLGDTPASGDASDPGTGKGGIDGSTPLTIDSPAGNPGGIDFRSLPRARQGAAQGQSPIHSVPIAMMGTVPLLDAERREIERMLSAGIVPSTQRLKEYLQACCGNGAVEKEIDKLLSCIADILRLEEERCADTEGALREILALLEQDKPVQELQLALAGIKVEAKEPAIAGE